MLIRHDLPICVLGGARLVGTEIKAPAPPKFWPHELILGLLPLLIGLQILVWINYVPASLRGITDFRTWYAAAYMVRTGQAQDIYDMRKLQDVKESLVPLGHPLMQPAHLAFEAALLVPLTYLGYRPAYTLFTAVNLIIVGWCIVALSARFHVLSARWKYFVPALFICFFPISRAITQGQDSVLLLAAFIAADILLSAKHDFAAGIFLGMGFTKFQIVLPIALLFLLWGRRKVFCGAAVAAASVLVSSFVIVGPHAVHQYWEIIAGMSFRLRTVDDALRYAISPRTMLNIRGLLSALLAHWASHWFTQAIIAISSVALFVYAAKGHPSLALAISASALVSYHLLAHDAAMLIIPILYCLNSYSRFAGIAAACALVLPNFAIVPLYGFVGGIGVAMLFVAVRLHGNCSSPGVGLLASNPAVGLLGNQ